MHFDGVLVEACFQRKSVMVPSSREEETTYAGRIEGQDPRFWKQRRHFLCRAEGRHGIGRVAYPKNRNARFVCTRRACVKRKL